MNFPNNTRFDTGRPNRALFTLAAKMAELKGASPIAA